MSRVNVNAIYEATAGNGVTIEDVLFRDGAFQQVGLYNARAYGASPSASAATNTTAFADAIAAASAAASPGGAIVFVPPGTYDHNGIALASGVILRGASRRATILNNVSDSGAHSLSLTQPAVEDISSNYFSVGIEDLRLQHGGTDTGDGIFLPDVQKFHISRVDVISPGGYGIRVRATTFNAVLDQVEVTSATLDGVLLVQSGVGRVTLVTLRNVAATTCRNGIVVDGGDLVQMIQCTGQDAVYDGATRTTGNGFRILNCQRSSLVDCWAERNESYGYRIEASEQTTLDRPWATSADVAGIYVNATCNYVAIREPYYRVNVLNDLEVASGAQHVEEINPFNDGGTHTTSGTFYAVNTVAHSVRAARWSRATTGGGVALDLDNEVDTGFPRIHRTGSNSNTSEGQLQYLSESAKGTTSATFNAVRWGANTLGFFNATPATQPTAVADASGGATIDAEARTALNALLARLRTLGVIAT